MHCAYAFVYLFLARERYAIIYSIEETKLEKVCFYNNKRNDQRSQNETLWKKRIKDKIVEWLESLSVTHDDQSK